MKQQYSNAKKKMTIDLGNDKEGLKPKYGSNLFDKKAKDDINSKQKKPGFETISHELNIRKRCRTRNDAVRNTTTHTQKDPIGKINGKE